MASQHQNANISENMIFAKIIRPSQQGITLLKVQGRTFRVPTASLPGYKPLASQSSYELAVNSASLTKNLTTIRVPIPASSYGAVAGRGDQNIKYIRANSGAQVDLSTSDSVVIIKGTQDQIDAARARLETANSPVRPTHFLSLPLTDGAFIRNVIMLKNDILAMNLPDVDDSIFMPSAKLHATLGVSKLYKQKIESAVDTLKGLQGEVTEFLGDKELIVKVKGLKFMDGDNRSTRNAAVIYTEMEEVEEEGKLKVLCDFLIAKHIEAGILERETRPFKLHVTIINTKYRKLSADSSQKNSRSKPPIDARLILEKFGDVELGTIRIGSIHLCRMGGVDEKGRYPSEGGIKLP